MKKLCGKCGRRRSLKMFPKNRVQDDGLGYYCQECSYAAIKEYRKRFPESTVLQAIRNKCGNPNNPSYIHYGAKGIKVCKRWRHFKVFLEDMGKRSSKKYTLARIDPTKDFEPENCRWEVRKWGEMFESPQTKLTKEKVEHIRASLANGISGSVLAKELGVTRACISLVKLGKTWGGSR